MSRERDMQCNVYFPRSIGNLKKKRNLAQEKQDVVEANKSKENIVKHFTMVVFSLQAFLFECIQRLQFTILSKQSHKFTTAPRLFGYITCFVYI